MLKIRAMLTLKHCLYYAYARTSNGRGAGILIQFGMSIQGFRMISNRNPLKIMSDIVAAVVVVPN